ncbi:MAG TPA: 1-acyl-sn-glycerol-3-phosphate acyltransferase [Candidatus Caenarcaniphilales bacterium]
MTSYVSPWLAPLLYRLGRSLLLPLYFKRIEVIGRQHLPSSGPVLLAPTHRARWDALMIPYAAGQDITGRDLRFMVSHDEMQGIQGWFVRRFGGFSVDTKRPTIASLRHGVELLQAGETLVIFPEGNIFRDRRINPLKPGLARLAIQAEADKPGLGIIILPVAIHYSQLPPRWRCDVHIQIGSPLKVATYCIGPTKQAAQRLTADLEASLQNLASCKTPETGSLATKYTRLGP